MTWIYDYERGIIVDDETGLVIEENLVSPEPEWRIYSPEDRLRKPRTGGTVTFKAHHSGVTSYIGDRDLDKLNRRVRYLRRHDVTLSTALGLMNRVSASLGLPGHVRETAGMIIRRTAGKKILNRMNMTAVVAVAILRAGVIHDIYIDRERLKAVLGIDDKKIHNTWKKLIRNEVLSRVVKPGISPTPFSKTVLRRASQLLGLSPEICSLAEEIIERAVKKRPLLSGGKPEILAASAIYIASILLDRRIIQDEVAGALGITMGSIQRRYRKILEIIDIEVMI